MDKDVRTKLEHIRDQIDSLLNQEELTFVDTLYGERNNYKLYLFPKSTEKHLNWHDAKKYCNSLGGDLPTIGELRFMHDNGLSKTFDYRLYWSSTEYSNIRAYRYTFYSGITIPLFKTYPYYTRPVKRCYI